MVFLSFDLASGGGGEGIGRGFAIFAMGKYLVDPAFIQGPAFVTAPFNNMRTPKFKAQPTNALFAAINQIFGGFFPTSDHSRALNEIFKNETQIANCMTSCLRHMDFDRTVFQPNCIPTVI